MLHRGLFAEVTVTSVEHPPSVSHRGILNTNQRLSHTKQRLSRLSTLSSTYSYTNHRFSVLFALCLLLPSLVAFLLTLSPILNIQASPTNAVPQWGRVVLWSCMSSAPCAA